MLTFTIVILITLGFITSFVYRGTATILALLTVTFMMIYAIDNQGHPRLNTFNNVLYRSDIEKADVLWYASDESEGKIFVLLYAPELSNEPRYIYYPYSHEMSEELNNAFREAELNNTSVEVFKPFQSEGSETDDMEFHLKPVEADPEKNSGG